MGVFKELFSEIENLERTQTRIFSDACDIGHLDTKTFRADMLEIINEMPEKEKSDIRGMCNELLGRKCVGRIFWDPESGVEIIISFYQKMPGISKAYWNIEIKPFNLLEQFYKIF